MPPSFIESPCATRVEYEAWLKQQEGGLASTDAEEAKRHKKAALERELTELLSTAKQQAEKLRRRASKARFIVLTGGPGTGKTTLIDQLRESTGCTVM